MKKKLNIQIITLFPEIIQNYFGFGIIARAIKQKLISFSVLNLRSFGLDKRGTVDDRPYGGGVGMVLRADVVLKAINKAKGKASKKTRVILLSPQGKPFKQKEAKRLVKYEKLVFVCGRYEGFDERVRSFVDEELSVGDYVLMGGELPALVASEAILRLVPGVLGKFESQEFESFSNNLLEYPQYTKPEVLEIRNKGKGLKVRGTVKKMAVPKVLLTGHHANIEAWRKDQSLKRTKKRRPDLLKK